MRSFVISPVVSLNNLLTDDQIAVDLKYHYAYVTSLYWIFLYNNNVIQ